jgi:hypothetical protein
MNNLAPLVLPRPMTEEVLSRLDAVRRTGNGWRARCPAHADQTPSLSIREGERGLLVYCWSGCTLADICKGMNLSPKDLFFDAPTRRGQRPAPKPIRKDPRETAFRFELAAFDLRGRAERIFEAAQKVEVSTLTETDLDEALAHVAQAYCDLERADLFEGVADDLRSTFGKEKV